MKGTLTFTKTPKKSMSKQKAILTFKKPTPIPIFKNGRIKRMNPNKLA